MPVSTRLIDDHLRTWCHCQSRKQSYCNTQICSIRHANTQQPAANSWLTLLLTTAQCIILIAWPPTTV